MDKYYAGDINSEEKRELDGLHPFIKYCVDDWWSPYWELEEFIKHHYRVTVEWCRLLSEYRSQYYISKSEYISNFDTCFIDKMSGFDVFFPPFFYKSRDNLVIKYESIHDINSNKVSTVI